MESSMNKDILEEFISKNKTEFDDAEVPAEVWTNIDHHLQKGQKKSWFYDQSILKIAASFIILFGLGIVCGMYLVNTQSEKQFIANNNIQQEYKEAEDYYIQLVDNKMNQLNQHGEHDEVLNDINQLEVIYQELKSELMKSNYSNQELLIEAMINNYKTRVDILETVLSKIAQSNNSIIKSNNNEYEKIEI